MKGAYKKRPGSRNAAYREGGSYSTRRRDRRRRRRILGIALLVCILAVTAVVYYLVNQGEITQGVLLGGSAANEDTSVSGSQVGSTGEGEAGGKAAGDQAPEDATASMVLLGEYFTDYAWDPDQGRQSNLKMASGAINNTRLKPGEVFSALKVLEPLDYEQAKVFTDGGVAYEKGGGLCQVSSTLFMAANYAGLEIVDRNPHYAELPYIRPGFDATVWFGNVDSPPLDMQFKNSTDGDIIIKEFVNDDGFLIAQIYGEKPTGKAVSMGSEKVEENTLKGIKWLTSKKVTENGKVIEDGTLYETTYSYNPPVPAEFKHETNEPRGSGWLDMSNTTGWNNKN